MLAYVLKGYFGPLTIVLNLFFKCPALIVPLVHTVSACKQVCVLLESVCLCVSMLLGIRVCMYRSRQDRARYRAGLVATMNMAILAIVENLFIVLGFLFNPRFTNDYRYHNYNNVYGLVYMYSHIYRHHNYFCEYKSFLTISI